MSENARIRRAKFWMATTHSLQISVSPHRLRQTSRMRSTPFVFFCDWVRYFAFFLGNVEPGYLTESLSHAKPTTDNSIHPCSKIKSVRISSLNWPFPRSVSLRRCSWDWSCSWRFSLFFSPSVARGGFGVVGSRREQKRGGGIFRFLGGGCGHILATQRRG